MKGRRWLLFTAGAVGAIFIFLILMLVFVPDHELQGIAERMLEREGYSLRARQFGKVFPLGIKAVDLEIAGERGVLLKAKEATVRIGLLRLMTGKLLFTCRAVIGDGHIGVEYSPRNQDIHIESSGVRLEDIPFFQTVADARVKGDLRLNGSVGGKGKAAHGELRLEVKGANVSGVKIGDMALPDADYSLIQGMFREKGGVVMLDSFTFQGEGLYVRLKGDFPQATPFGDAPLNLSLELMPKPEFLEKQKFVFILLNKYLTTPGHYDIPVRGTLVKPLLQ